MSVQLMYHMIQMVLQNLFALCNNVSAMGHETVYLTFIVTVQVFY